MTKEQKISRIKELRDMSLKEYDASGGKPTALILHAMIEADRMTPHTFAELDMVSDTMFMTQLRTFMNNGGRVIFQDAPESTG